MVNISTEYDIVKSLEVMKRLIHELQNGMTNYVIINTFIENFMKVNEELDIRGIEFGDKIKSEKMADILVSIVNCFNEKDNIRGISLIKEQLVPFYNIWEKNVNKKFVYNVLIAGINSFSPKFHRLVTELRHTVIGYLNFPHNTTDNTELSGVPVFSIDEIDESMFDYIIIISEQHVIVESVLKDKFDEKKILNYMSLSINFSSVYNKIYYNDYEFSFVYNNLEKAMQQNDIDVVITGMSYPLKGLITDLLVKKSVKLCWASQDLYYNYQLIKRALDQNKNFKYCIIGMAYYTFDIDLSQLKSQTYLIDKIYYPLLNDSHHYMPSETYIRQPGIEAIDQMISLPHPFNSTGLIKSFTTSIGLLQDDELIDSIWNKCDNVPIEWLGKRRAYLHGKHDYPETRKENIEIFKSLLSLLKENNIEPIIIVFPTSELYRPFQNPDTKKRFYEIMNQIKTEYQFSLHDFFDSELFVQSDFADADHLNKKGAYKMTSLINNTVFK